MAKIITKIFRPYNGEQLAMAQVHSNNYGSSLGHINELADILKKDFPEIRDEDIQVHKYGGQRVKNITFVEVQLAKSKIVPEGYHEVTDIELIL